MTLYTNEDPCSLTVIATIRLVVFWYNQWGSNLTGKCISKAYMYIYIYIYNELPLTKGNSSIGPHDALERYRMPGGGHLRLYSFNAIDTPPRAWPASQFYWH